ncbi:hypothetical protein [Streptomyces sp. HC307]|uniref:hypothetical protein n=1 Tax=Streptomyces flavusporus TaxID=3385496 RepID=UPI00391753F6
MSEYQYYEFQALDRPLSREEQDHLRAISTRARITTTSFTHTYNWGDLRGNPRRMVERYFGAHLYVTNWGTRRLMLRLPKQTLALPTTQVYCLDHHVNAWTTRTHLLLEMTGEDEGGDWIEGADDSLAALIGVRDELATGDLRPLYLAWLSALTAWDSKTTTKRNTRPVPNRPSRPGSTNRPPHSARSRTSCVSMPTCSRPRPRPVPPRPRSLPGPPSRNSRR